MRALAVLLLLAALVAGGLGLLFLSSATSGVGLLCWACLLAIIARIAQASNHHQELWEAIERLKPVIAPATVKPPPPIQRWRPVGEMSA